MNQPKWIAKAMNAPINEESPAWKAYGAACNFHTKIIIPGIVLLMVLLLFGVVGHK